jgi:pimeloyl-ACP methyl ester carboxylesterase
LSRDCPLPDHITPYDRCAWRDDVVELMLQNGEHEQELAAYFGAREYAELRQLALRGSDAPRAAACLRVFIIPGIMGSQLGLQREAPHPVDVLWLDPIDIGVGKLNLLRPAARAAVRPLGVMLYSYLRLKLQLRAGGFAPVCYDYDWRLGIDQLGASLAQRLRSEPADEIMLVGHSMGGLVCRAALRHEGMQKVRRVVLLGTPNSGSFAPLQALRGTYPVVRRIAMLTADRSAEALASEIFNRFPSLYHLLPESSCLGGVDLLRRANWPKSGPQPDPALLRQARGVRGRLAAADARVDHRWNQPGDGYVSVPERRWIQLHGHT